MELVLASNFDDALVAGVADLPVSTFFGNFPVTLVGGGRPPQILPRVSEVDFRRHVEAVHSAGRKFYATLNSNDLDLREYAPEFLPEVREEVARLVRFGVDGVVVAVPALIEAIASEFPGLSITVSTFARVRSVTEAEYYQRLGADTVVIEEGNRDFRLLRGLVRLGMRVELLVNQTCIPGCPYRAHHLSTSSTASQRGRSSPRFEYPIVECGLEYVRDPSRLISSILVRPEDLAVYEEAGVDRFKISGRNRSTDWLLRSARAYAARRYDGNLLDIVSFVQVLGPLAALGRLRSEHPRRSDVRRLGEAFGRLGDVRIDNRAFPPDFRRRIARTDCAHVACSECGYCAAVAERVLRIDGKPPSEYAAPGPLPPPVGLLPMLGPPGD